MTVDRRAPITIPINSRSHVLILNFLKASRNALTALWRWTLRGEKGAAVTIQVGTTSLCYLSVLLLNPIHVLILLFASSCTFSRQSPIRVYGRSFAVEVFL